jgi:hypothetical protein
MAKGRSHETSASPSNAWAGAQIGFLSAYLIRSATMILLDVLVLFALTARWSEARAAM